MQVTGFRRHLFYNRAATDVSLTTLGQWVARRRKKRGKKEKGINPYQRGQYFATVNILSYGACVLTEKVRKHLKMLISRINTQGS